jgi:hypothetical protein
MDRRLALPLNGRSGMRAVSHVFVPSWLVVAVLVDGGGVHSIVDVVVAAAAAAAAVTAAAVAKNEQTNNLANKCTPTQQFAHHQHHNTS